MGLHSESSLVTKKKQPNEPRAAPQEKTNRHALARGQQKQVFTTHNDFIITHAVTEDALLQDEVFYLMNRCC